MWSYWSHSKMVVKLSEIALVLDQLLWTYLMMVGYLKILDYQSFHESA